MSRLNLDRDRVESCRHLAQKIARNIQEFVDRHTTVSIERAVLRLMGVEEAYKGRPLANAVIDAIPRPQLSLGVCTWIGRALAHQRSTPIALSLRIAEGRLKLETLPAADSDQIQRAIEPAVRGALRRLDEAREKRRRGMESFPRRDGSPLKYVIVATGNIHEDAEQARAAVLNGADCIAVIRSTAQSLLDYVPHGATTEGIGGTYATQENFRIMRRALDEVGRKVGRYIRLVNYSSGLCMPEIAVMGAVEHLDYLLNDSMYGILFRDIAMKRTFVDQYFSRLVIARAGLIINTGEDNYLTTAESFRAFPQVIASQFINEQLGFLANLSEEQLGLGHAFEIDPTIEDSLLYEIAQAEMVREIFPRSPIKYMPPTRHMTGDIFFGQVLDSLFNLVGVMTGQAIQLLGMPTEAIHNPLLQDRFVSLKAANYIFRAARSLGDEVSWNPNGKVIRRARSVLDDAHKLLGKVAQVGLMPAIAQGMFANMTREIEGGRGLDGVIRRDHRYFNPIFKALEKRPVAEEVPFEVRRPMPAPTDERREAGTGEERRRDHHRRGRGGRGRHRRGPRRPSARPQATHPPAPSQGHGTSGPGGRGPSEGEGS